MNKTVSFNELRRIKDNLPQGSMQKIAEELNISVDAVRNYFGGKHSVDVEGCGIHIEPGPDGGVVMLDDSAILEKALIILGETNFKVSSID
ncbi:hypothetical protein AwDysgo_08970 [Bacteroidales bacterium]|nr:hypothetical protein AwDysgo_08970 [Bacteroidales bacterium]